MASMRGNFLEYKDGIYYYDFIVEIEGAVRHITLPRYDVFLGWIEIFGLPPQNEWVVIADIDTFTKSAELTIDGQVYTESCSYTPDTKNKTHTVEVIRSGKHVTEKAIWIESYSHAPNAIQNTMEFTSSDSKYMCEVEKTLTAIEQLEGEELQFVSEIFSNNGKTNHIWKKSFAAKGDLPEMYHTMFPEISGLDLSNVKGSVVEVGYMAKGDSVDAVHGDWYKRFQLHDQVLYVNESGYTSRVVETEYGPQKIKDTYYKKLYR